jgi:hypothetical protein
MPLIARGILTRVKPVRPSEAMILPNPSPILLYIVGLACQRELESFKWKRTTYLLATLDNIKWADGGVGEPACKDTASHAFSVVAEVVDV